MIKVGCCIHFNGVQNRTCEFGMDYEKFRVEGRSMLATLPCFDPKATACPHRREPTAQDIADDEKEAEKAIAPMLKISEQFNCGQTFGSFSHDDCGGTITWRAINGDSMALRAKCDKCEWSMMS